MMQNLNNSDLFRPLVPFLLAQHLTISIGDGSSLYALFFGTKR